MEVKLEVIYLKCSIFSEPEKVTQLMSQKELTRLLVENGMICLLSVRQRVIGGKQWQAILP